MKILFSSAVLLAFVHLLFDVTHCYSPSDFDWSQFNPDHQAELDRMIHLFNSAGYAPKYYYLAFKAGRRALYSIHPEAKDLLLQQTLFLVQALFASSRHFEHHLPPIERHQLATVLHRLNLLVDIGEKRPNDQLIEASSRAMPPPDGSLRLHYDFFFPQEDNGGNSNSRKVPEASATLEHLVATFMLDSRPSQEGIRANDHAQLRLLFLVAFAPRIIAAYRFVYPFVNFDRLVSKTMAVRPGDVTSNSVPFHLRTTSTTRKATYPTTAFTRKKEGSYVAPVPPPFTRKDKPKKALKCLAGLSGSAILLGLLTSYLLYRPSENGTTAGNGPNRPPSGGQVATGITTIIQQHPLTLYYFALALLIVVHVGGILLYCYRFVLHGKNEDGEDGEVRQEKSPGSSRSKRVKPASKGSSKRSKSKPKTAGKRCRSSKVPSPKVTTSTVGYTS